MEKETKLQRLILNQLRDFFEKIGKIVNFSLRFLRMFFSPPFEGRELFKQIYLLGYKSLLLIGITSFIVGMVFTMQSYPTMASLGTESWIPTMISISVVREIGPLITALIFAGKVGSGIGAELGSMKVTEQIDAMTVSGTKPMNFLIVTRVSATTIAVPLLVLYADALAMGGSFFAFQSKEDVTLNFFFNQAMSAITFTDFIPSLIKSAFFGFAIGMVSCYQGFYAENGTQGVGYAANTSVVISSFIIFIIDLVVVQIQSFYL
ncbi:MAG: ABC transporter permease [Cyclobacteriaceae bacterium]|nr:ABC transporter permease [Cyclobacteriaceae bacterium]